MTYSKYMAMIGSDIVVTPLYKRPEFFKVWTDIVKKAHGAENLFYLFCLDSGYDRTHDRLIREFPFRHGVITMPPTKYKLTKQSYNVLNGMMAAAKHTDKLVYYIEEDIFIAKDFFKWHQEVHRQQKDVFCSIGTRNNNTKWKTDGFLQHYYLSDNGDYQSLGSCFKKEVILDMILPHFTEEYFRSPVDYCQLHFPASKIGRFFAEQDGLIRRILEFSGMSTAFPHVPRAFHGGIYGYNRVDSSNRKLNFQQKIDKIKEIAFNKENLKKYVKDQAFYRDSEPCELDIDHDYLECVNTFILT